MHHLVFLIEFHRIIFGKMIACIKYLFVITTDKELVVVDDSYDKEVHELWFILYDGAMN